MKEEHNDDDDDDEDEEERQMRQQQQQQQTLSTTTTIIILTDFSARKPHCATVESRPSQYCPFFCFGVKDRGILPFT